MTNGKYLSGIFRSHFWGLIYLFMFLPFLGNGQLTLEDIVCTGLSGDEVAKEAIVTKDGGLLLLGEIDTPDKSLQILVTKLDPELEIEWSVDVGGIEYDLCEDIYEDDQGIIWISAYSTGGGFGRRDYYTVKMDPDGQVLKERFFGTAGDDALSLIEKGQNGELFLVGLSYGTERSSDIYTYRMDSDLKDVGQTRIFHPGSDAVWDIRQVGTDGWMMAGQTTGTSNGEKDFFLLRADMNGEHEWYMHYGGDGDDRAYAIERLQEQWILGGFSTSRSPGIRNGWILSVDDIGNYNWDLDLSHFQTMEIHDVAVYNDLILVTGFAFNPQTGNDLFLAEVSSDGQLRDLYMLETPLDQEGRSILIKDGKVLVFGENVGITDPDLCVYVYEWVALSNSDKDPGMDVRISPNPGSEQIVISPTFDHLQWSILDLAGHVLRSGFEEKIDVRDLSPATYWIRLIGDDRVYMRSWIKAP